MSNRSNRPTTSSRPMRSWLVVTIVAAGTFVVHQPGHGIAQDPSSKTSDPAAAETAVHLAAGKVSEIHEIGHWIDQLNDNAYPIRQAAAEQLLHAGMPARGPLLEVAEGPDPETRAAARRLVALIDRTEFHRRLEAFSRDEDGRQGLTLPGWKLFRERIGDDAAARELFVEMQRHEGALLAAVYGVRPQPLNGVWEERLVRLVQWQVTLGDRSVAPSLGTCATMLFLGSIPDTQVSDRGAVLVENLIQRPPLRENMQAGNHKDAVRRLVVSWIMHCPNRSEVILNRRLYMASMNQLHEALPLALGIAEADGEYAAVQAPTRAAALLLVGQLGSREHVQRIEPLLEDTSVCAAVGPGGATTNVQLRDVALVVLLHLTGQRPADYGYVHARLQPEQMFQLQTLSVENDGRRSEALQKWRQWRAAHFDNDASNVEQLKSQNSEAANPRSRDQGVGRSTGYRRGQPSPH